MWVRRDRACTASLLPVLMTLALSACALDTNAVFDEDERDGGTTADAGAGMDGRVRFDASMDAAVVDGGPRDAQALDAPAPDDAPSDATVPIDGGCADADGDGVCDVVDVCPGSDDGADRDGDTVPDGCDVCPDDAADDSDGDGVCDSSDVCAGSDDRADVDGDGTPDGCDPCPINGPAAAPIPTTASGSGITIDSVSLAGGGNVALVDAGASVPITLHYAITDCGCPGCIDQIEIGLVPAPSFQYCAYSAQPRCSGAMGTNTGTLRAPMTPGVYSVRFGRAQNYGCTHETWWDGTPVAARTIGAICVR